jgi:hypothetical protein
MKNRTSHIVQWLKKYREEFNKSPKNRIKRLNSLDEVSYFLNLLTPSEKRKLNFSSLPTFGKKPPDEILKYAYSWNDKSIIVKNTKGIYVMVHIRQEKNHE